VFKISPKNLKYFLLVFLLVFFIPRLAGFLSSPLQKTLKPQLSLLGLAQREINGLFSYHYNYLENERLRKESSLLRSKFVEFKELYQENTRLKSLLSFKKKSSFKLIAARVIARSPDNWSASLIIDKGRYNGIQKGMAVISCQGLVGKVAEAAEGLSKVMLISDPGLGISGLVQRTRQEGLVNGTLGGSLIMRYLPEDADIAQNDIIITSELSRNYPKGIIIGKVVNIGNEFSGLNRYAMIKPAADLANAEELLVIIP